MSRSGWREKRETGGKVEPPKSGQKVPIQRTIGDVMQEIEKNRLVSVLLAGIHSARDGDRPKKAVG